MASKLTSLSTCAGCAAKLGQKALQEVLRRLPMGPADPRLLIGAETADDAAVFLLTSRIALVQTVDFFTPIVDDPFTYGQIAATNAISDVYAMGGRPLTALNLVGIPTEEVSPQVLSEILRGGLSKAAEARCAVVGGHTIRLPEPVYGMAVTGIVSPRRTLTNARARPGDWLVLTKPLGTGIVTTGIVTTGIKRGMASRAIQRKTIRAMTKLNSVGARLAEMGLVRAATDVTGFGLLGHLGNVCRASKVSAEVDADSVPALGKEVLQLIEKGCIPGGSVKNLETADEFTDWGGAADLQRHLLTDAQTSGGLLLCIAPKRLDLVRRFLSGAGALCAAVIGRVVAPRNPLVSIVRPTARIAGFAIANGAAVGGRLKNPRPNGVNVLFPRGRRVPSVR